MKKLMIALLAVALGLSLYGTASAVDINVYGASAQYNFWSKQGQNWLLSATGANCGSISAGPLSYTSSGAPFHGQKYFFITGASCGAVGGGSITVRVTAADSFDGLDAVAQLPYAFDSVVPNSPNTHHLDPMAANGTPCGTGQRTMLADATNNPPNFPADYGCFPVVLGASDVTPDIFTQHTNFAGSYFDGPKGTAAAWGPINLSTGSNLPAGMGGLTHFQPVVVPFGLWLNNSVQLATCASSSPVPYAGSPCDPSSSGQCGTGGTCQAAANVTNLPLEWLNLILTGKVANWNQLNSAFSSVPVTLCLRVPGSGTLATLDYAVLKRTGGSLPVRESTSTAPFVWFNFTSGDVEKCVNAESGAIGILDADDTAVTIANGGYGPVGVEGQLPTRTNIRTGLYDYFTFENLYESASCSGDISATGCNQLVTNFTDFSNLPENITASGRSLYASTAEMLVTKAGANYPSVTPGGAMSLCELTGAPVVGGENPGAICAGASPAGNVGAVACVGSTACVQENCATNSANAPGLCP